MNLAAITAALCAGPDAHPDPARRYWAAVVAGLTYVAFGLLAGTATAFIAASPPVLIEAVAGLALLGAFGSALFGAVSAVEGREAALATFLVTASGQGFFGVSGAFWGLLAGGAVVVTALAGGCLTARPSQVLPTSGTIQKDCETRPEIVLVPAGTFTMGIPEAERLCEGKADSFYLETDKYARPQTKIAIAHAFWMGRYPVTRGQYAQFVAETGYAGGGNEWKDPGFPQDDTHPVVNVSALDAEAYAAWLSKKTGSVYRLPSDAEWEYAARAGTVTARYCGDGFADALRYAWVNRQGTASVISQRLPNAFQLSDMLGNV